MTDQQTNLNQQPPASETPTQQPPSNKLWPINWRHNKFLKIFVALQLLSIPISFLSYIFILIIKANSGYFHAIDCGFYASRPTPSIDACSIHDGLLFIVGFFPFLLGILFLIISPFFIMRYKTLDRLDKLFFIINFITPIFLFIFYILITYLFSI